MASGGELESNGCVFIWRHTHTPKAALLSGCPLRIRFTLIFSFYIFGEIWMGLIQRRNVWCKWSWLMWSMVEVIVVCESTHLPACGRQILLLSCFQIKLKNPFKKMLLWNASRSYLEWCFLVDFNIQFSSSLIGWNTQSSGRFVFTESRAPFWISTEITSKR